MWLQWKAIEPELTHKEAAKRLGIAPQTLTNTIYTASKEGWLKFTDPLAEFKYHTMPKVVHNLNYYLDQGDRDVTVKVAQGTLFKQFLDNEGVRDATPTTILALKIEMPPNLNTAMPSDLKGSIVGTPRNVETVEAEIIGKPKA